MGDQSKVGKAVESDTGVRVGCETSLSLNFDQFSDGKKARAKCTGTYNYVDTLNNLGTRHLGILHKKIADGIINFRQVIKIPSPISLGRGSFVGTVAVIRRVHRFSEVRLGGIPASWKRKQEEGGGGYSERWVGTYSYASTFKPRQLARIMYYQNR